MEQEQRKNWKGYQDDYRNALLKVALVEARAQKRAIALCKANPDVVIYGGELQITAKDYVDSIKMKTYTTTPEKNIDVIKKIEQHIADKHPHQQLNLYDEVIDKDSDMCVKSAAMFGMDSKEKGDVQDK